MAIVLICLTPFIHDPFKLFKAANSLQQTFWLNSVRLGHDAAWVQKYSAVHVEVGDHESFEHRLDESGEWSN